MSGRSLRSRALNRSASAADPRRQSEANRVYHPRLCGRQAEKPLELMGRRQLSNLGIDVG